MNNSGVAVKQAVVQKKINLESVLVACDDVHLDFGQVRIRTRGSDGGHNGLTSLIQKLATKDFTRLRLGVGSPKRKEDLVDYVLDDFSKKERKELDLFIQKAADCCTAWLTQGAHKAMDQFNKRMVA